MPADSIGALSELTSLLREEDTPISSHVVDSGEHFTDLPGEYAFVLEAVREGYLLHYGTPRILAGHDDDLALLAGDYLYALGIERLAGLGDSKAVVLLADLISGCARLHAEGREAEVPALWLSTVEAIGGAFDAAEE
ncbi:MAG TPA: hypothetical protein VNM89_03980 [Solirubrobacterales bacterium]|nr:hypothetical protein [Solirubrobacterales bacterium]